MRLTRRLDAIASRLPHDATGGEAAINRAVFGRYQRDTDAVLAAAPPIDFAAYTRAFEAAYAAHGPALLEEMGRYFAEAMAREETEYGPWVMVPGHGRIRQKDYLRLRTQVTGGRDAAHHTP